MSMKKTTAITAAVIGMFAASAIAQEFHIIGEGFTPTGISDNGVVAGTSDALGQYFTWTAGGGAQGIGGVLPNDGPGGQASISNDGLRIGGTALNTNTGLTEMSYYSVNSGSWVNLGGLGGTLDGGTSSGWGISGDGRHVVGLGWTAGFTAHAIQWTEGMGTFDLGSTVIGNSSRANAASGDGSVVAGWQDDEFGFRQGAVWVNGVQRQIFDNDGVQVQEGSAVSDDGQWVTGIANGDAAWRYNTFTEQFSYIDSLQGDFFFPTAYGSDISNDGQTIIGAVGGFGPAIFREGFIWREGMGTMLIGDFLSASGVSFEDGFSFFGPFAMSNDGNSFTGWGLDARGSVVGWYATVPSPAPLALLSIGSIFATRRKR